MVLEFHGDAICLSGETGTKLKSKILEQYYPFWWKIVSGGKSKNYPYQTTIIELDAATGEIYIEETGETLLGSAGHALSLKCNDLDRTRNLRIVLIEQNDECFNCLKNVIHRRFRQLPANITKYAKVQMDYKINLLNLDLDAALNKIEDWFLGNSLYYFDPLLCVEWATIEKVAAHRIKTPFETGTEFIIFLFTSDWFIGRNDFAPLPESINEEEWDKAQKETVEMADKLFGNQDWRPLLLCNVPIEKRQEKMIEFYRKLLLKWFRYVLPLPFKPKLNQLYHLIICSNFETGIQATRGFYKKVTGNPKYTPSNKSAFNRFKQLHPETLQGLRGNQRPNVWKILWRIIRYLEGSICDSECKELIDVIDNLSARQIALEWLHNQYYLKELKHILWAWPNAQLFTRFVINWATVKEKLGIDPPPRLEPIQTIS